MTSPNPAVIRRRRQKHHTTPVAPKPSSLLLTGALVALLAVLVATTSWARRWLLSGAAIESVLLIYGDIFGTRIFSNIPLWSLLTSLNLLYAVCSTSWLLNGILTAAYVPFVFGTLLFQSSFVADFARHRLRSALKQLHFTRDKIALFNLPALEIDTEVDGLMVVRGITISLSSLTIVAHGIELGLKLSDDIELSMYADEVHIALFRRIDIGDVFGNVKGGELEMTFGAVAHHDDPDSGDDAHSIFLNDTPLLRAATLGSESVKGHEVKDDGSDAKEDFDGESKPSEAGVEMDRPKMRQSLTGGVHTTDSSVQAGVEEIRTLSPDNDDHEKQYMATLKDINVTSPVHQGREKVRQKALEDPTLIVSDEKDMRAAICAELHSVPSISHPPERSIRVTTLQHLSKPAVREFLHRLPLLLRLLLGPLSYFHPININSVSVAGSGKWLTALLHDKVFKHYADNNAELRRLTKKVSTWLADAHFCLQLDNIDALGQVPLSTDFDIVTYMHFADVMAYRTTASVLGAVPTVDVEDPVSTDPERPPSPKKHHHSHLTHTDSLHRTLSHHSRHGRHKTQDAAKPIAQVIRLGGADAMFTIPSYLLPHHEHIIPPPPTIEDEQDQSLEVEKADGKPKTVQAQQELEKMRKDEANITMSVHGSLPVCLDQSLLNFAAALVKATKIIELEKTADEEAAVDPYAPSAPNPNDDAASIASSMTSASTSTQQHEESHLKHFAKSLRHGPRGAIRELAKDMHQSTKDGFKKAVVGSVVNDRWIAKMVGKVASKLEAAQGDLGYSGSIPVPLGEYRDKCPGENPSKLLP